MLGWACGCTSDGENGLMYAAGEPTCGSGAMGGSVEICGCTGVTAVCVCFWGASSGVDFVGVGAIWSVGCSPPVGGNMVEGGRVVSSGISGVDAPPPLVPR